MLFLNCFQTFLLFAVVLFPLSKSQRKIKDGRILHHNDAKRYMVYLVRAVKKEVPAYDAWICGGAIATPDFIVTSAACIQDIQYMYAIAGYSKYVKYNKIDEDACTKNAKKKIIFICVPKNYEFSYEAVTKWSNIDIAVVQVDTPYDFSRKEPLPGCHWAPDKIEVNYEDKYQKEGIDAMVLGWGHTNKFRQRNDKTDYNQAELRYSSIILENKQICIDAYEHIEGMANVIKKYMLCAFGEGNIDASGRLIKKAVPDADGCVGAFVRIGGLCHDPAKYEEFMRMNPHLSDAQKTMYLAQSKAQYEQYLERYRQYQLAQYEQKVASVDQVDDEVSYRRNSSDANNGKRRAGICQNDHGGPLVTWVGAREVLIGVASTFLLDGEMECTGPFLFTSTQCNGAFLSCVLNITFTRSAANAYPYDFRRSDFCNMPNILRNFEIVQRRISWANHSDGPAANERSEDLVSKKHVHFKRKNLFESL